MAGDDPYTGRRPSFGAHGGIRAFRSRPGAPLADPTQNIGAAGLGSTIGGVTPVSNWDRIFKDFRTGQVAQSVLDARAALHGGAAKPASSLASELPEDQQANLHGTGTTPSIQSLAGGGNTHQQMWSQPYAPKQLTPNTLAGMGYESGNPADIAQKYQTQGISTAADYGWGQAFQNPNG